MLEIFFTRGKLKELQGMIAAAEESFYDPRADHENLFAIAAFFLPTVVSTCKRAI